MQIQDFLKIYQAKTDDELIRLGSAPAHLTSEALIVLQSELSESAWQRVRRLVKRIENGMSLTA